VALNCPALRHCRRQRPGPRLIATFPMATYGSRICVARPRSTIVSRPSTSSAVRRLSTSRTVTGTILAGRRHDLLQRHHRRKRSRIASFHNCSFCKGYFISMGTVRLLGITSDRVVLFLTLLLAFVRSAIIHAPSSNTTYQIDSHLMCVHWKSRSRRLVYPNQLG